MPLWRVVGVMKQRFLRITQRAWVGLMFFSLKKRPRFETLHKHRRCTFFDTSDFPFFFSPEKVKVPKRKRGYNICTFARREKSVFSTLASGGRGFSNGNKSSKNKPAFCLKTVVSEKKCVLHTSIWRERFLKLF